MAHAPDGRLLVKGETIVLDVKKVVFSNPSLEYFVDKDWFNWISLKDVEFLGEVNA
jgi:protein associated with RNAse G/E